MQIVIDVPDEDYKRIKDMPDGERGSIYYGGYGDGHKDGLNDAWECARKIALRKDEARNAFHDIAPVKVFEEYSASEAIAKIKEYEEKQKANKTDDEIKVGDEVILDDMLKGVILDIDDSYIYGLVPNTHLFKEKKDGHFYKRTGRHFDQITEILKQLKEDKK